MSKPTRRNRAPAAANNIPKTAPRSPTAPAPQRGFCIFIDTIGEGTVPLWRAFNDLPSVFATQREAELQIADDLMDRLQRFMDNQRDFEDAITVEEYVVEVTVLPDGSVVDEFGRLFGSRRPPTETDGK